MLYTIIIDLLLLLAIPLAFYGLYRINFAKADRFKQWIFPLLSVLYLLIVYKYFTDYYLELRPEEPETGPAPPGGSQLEEKLKPVMDAIFVLLSILLFYVPKTIAKVIAGMAVKKPSALYYQETSGTKAYLEGYWYFGQLYLKYQVWALIPLGVISYFSLLYELTFVPVFSIFSLLLTLEFFWYLNGYLKDREEEPCIPASKPEVATASAYRELWEKYQLLFDNKLITAWHFEKETPGTEAVKPAKDSVLALMQMKGIELTERETDIFEKIDSGKDILLESSVYERFAPVFFGALYKKIARGENILVLTKNAIQSEEDPRYFHISKWMTAGFELLTGMKHFASPYCYNPLIVAPFSSNTVIASVDDILDNAAFRDEWFNNLTTLVIHDISDFFTGEISSLNILINIIRQKIANPQIIVLSSEYREGIESSIRNIININASFSEDRYDYPEPSENFILVWKADAEEDYQSAVLKGFTQKYLGIETILATLARPIAGEIKVMGLEGLPWLEYTEEIDNQSMLLRMGKTPDGSKISTGISFPTLPCMSGFSESAATFARDTFFNLPLALRHWNSFTHRVSIAGIVCPPYLLRSYFADNLKYFYKAPIFPYAPIMSENRFSAAYTLLRQMIAEELTDSQISEILLKNCRNIKINSTKEILQTLFKETLGFDNIEGLLTIRSEYVFNENKLTFEKKDFYGFNDEILCREQLGFQRMVSIKEGPGGNLIKRIPFDYLFQNYLEGQVHEFNGKSFRIENFDKENHILHINHVTPKQLLWYKASRKLEIMAICDCNDCRHKDKESCRHMHLSLEKKIRNRFHLSIMEAEFVVKTTGYFTFRNQISLKGQPEFTELGDVPPRHYSAGRVLKVDLLQNINVKVLAALHVLINELFCTVLPGSQEFLVCGHPGLSPYLLENYPVFSDYFGEVNLHGNNFPDKTDDGNHVIYIFEDGNQDLGYLMALFNHFENMLELMDDYLGCYGQSKNGVLPGKDQLKEDPDYKNDDYRGRLSEDNFLNYGFENTPGFFDLEGLKKLLSGIVPENKLSRDRQKYREF
jgi:hypothetical protein